MQVNIKQAIRLFFSNPSLDMVFIEAIANSLDADASKINICISIEELGKQETLKITVQDNGVGFTEERYAKFCKLLQVEDSCTEFVLNAWSPTFFTDLGRIISFNFLQPTKVHP